MGLPGYSGRCSSHLRHSVDWLMVSQAAFPAITTTIVSVRYPAPRFLQPDIFIPLHFLVANSAFPVPSSGVAPSLLTAL